MAKQKIKNPIPPTPDDVWNYARTLLEMAYRMKTNQLSDWAGKFW